MTSIDFMEMYKAEKKKLKEAKIKSIFSKREVVDIEKYKIGKIPNIYYFEDFITKEEEEILLSKIYDSKNEWINLENRRLQNSGGTPHHEGMIEEEFPKHFQDVGKLLKQSGFTKEVGKMNQVLLNEYKNGKGISYHKDGTLYFEFAAILSLKSKAIIHFKKDKKQEKSDASVILNERSLMIFTKDAYTEYFHGINSSKEDLIDENCLNHEIVNKKVGQTILRDKERVSLTIRRTIKSKDRIYTNEEEDEIKRRKEWWLQGINDKNE
eukprot:gene10896-3600_t